MSRAGRKLNNNISEEKMLMAIKDYTEQYPNEKINIKKLAETSGIERHYWYSRKDIKEKINDINNIRYEDFNFISEEDYKNLKMPNVDELVDNYFRNKRLLKEKLTSFFLTYQELFDSACNEYKIKKELNIIKNKLIKYESLIEKLKADKNHYKMLSEYYKNKYFENSLRSKDLDYRKENGLKENVITINNKNIKAYSTNENDLDTLLGSIDIDE